MPVRADVIRHFLHLTILSARRTHAVRQLWPNCVNCSRPSAIFLSRIAQLACAGALRSDRRRFKNSLLGSIGDGEHEPTLGGGRAVVP